MGDRFLGPFGARIWSGSMHPAGVSSRRMKPLSCRAAVGVSEGRAVRNAEVADVLLALFAPRPRRAVCGQVVPWHCGGEGHRIARFTGLNRQRRAVNGACVDHIRRVNLPGRMTTPRAPRIHRCTNGDLQRMTLVAARNQAVGGALGDQRLLLGQLPNPPPVELSDQHEVPVPGPHQSVLAERALIDRHHDLRPIRRRIPAAGPKAKQSRSSRGGVERAHHVARARVQLRARKRARVLGEIGAILRDAWG
mmetsp:Transcript_24760/g.55772  ORF Transcript_24760/g.55772 Transcript_24760/m.55772 type:complete len:250 (+) Transcript_24760:66-815(+)